MTFDLEGAKTRVKKELAVIIEQNWEKLPEHVRMVYGEKCSDEDVLERKIVGMYGSEGVLGESKHKFSMLYELSRDTYWHAFDHFSDLKPSLSKEDIEFYVTLAIEQAKRCDKKLGYAWIVREHDTGLIAEFVSPELLKESVNGGFWDFANKYFTEDTTPGILAPWDYFHIIMGHSDLLDFTKFKEFRGKPLNNESRWVDEKYMAAFERAKPNLSVEDAAWLVTPIIWGIVNKATAWEDGVDDPEKYLQKKLPPYKEYINTQAIQELLKTTMKDCIKCLGGDQTYHNMCGVEVLKPYVQISDDDFKELVSANLPREEETGGLEDSLEEDLVRHDFSKEWLTQKALSEIEDAIKKNLDSEGSGRTPYIGLLQDSVNGGWLDEKYGREMLKKSIENYISLKKRPAGQVAEDFLRSVDPKLVEQRLYRQMIHQGISDLVKRNRVITATEWYQKARVGGWLNKNKIPKFELEFPKNEPLQESMRVEQNRRRRTGRKTKPWERVLGRTHVTIDDFGKKTKGK